MQYVLRVSLTIMNVAFDNIDFEPKVIENNNEGFFLTRERRPSPKCPLLLLLYCAREGFRDRIVKGTGFLGLVHGCLTDPSNDECVISPRRPAHSAQRVFSVTFGQLDLWVSRGLAHHSRPCCIVTTVGQAERAILYVRLLFCTCDLYIGTLETSASRRVVARCAESVRVVRPADVERDFDRIVTFPAALRRHKLRATNWTPYVT